MSFFSSPCFFLGTKHRFTLAAVYTETGAVEVFRFVSNMADAELFGCVLCGGVQTTRTEQERETNMAVEWFVCV